MLYNTPVTQLAALAGRLNEETFSCAVFGASRTSYIQDGLFHGLYSSLLSTPPDLQYWLRHQDGLDEQRQHPAQHKPLQSANSASGSRHSQLENARKAEPQRGHAHAVPQSHQSDVVKFDNDAEQAETQESEARAGDLRIGGIEDMENERREQQEEDTCCQGASAGDQQRKSQMAA